MDFKIVKKQKNELNVINKCRKIQDMFREKTSTVESKYTPYKLNYTDVQLKYIYIYI